MNTQKYLSTITKRCSRRKYTSQEIDAEQVLALKSLIHSYNEMANLNMKLITEKGGELFDGLRKSYGMFSGVQNYIALIGKSDDPHRKEKVGRFGELLVLEATQMGLATCWVAGTYDKKSAEYLVREGEILECVIVIGHSAEKHSLRERFIEENLHRKNDAKYMKMDTAGKTPDWFFRGMDAVYHAPSALNLKPYLFHHQAGKVTAEITKESDYAMIDLGIAKLHFEIGAGGGTWEYGSPSSFHPNPSSEEGTD